LYKNVLKNNSLAVWVISFVAVFFVWGTERIPSDQILNNTLSIKNIILENFSFHPKINIFSSFALNAFIHFLPVVAITIYETSKLGFLNSSIARIRFSNGYKFADIYYLIFNIIINKFPFLVTIITLNLSFAYKGVNEWFLAKFESFIPNVNSEIYLSALILISLLLSDFSDFYRHYIMHKVPFLWDLHEFHHSPTEMTILSEYRDVQISKVIVYPITLPLTAMSAILLSISFSQNYFLPVLIFVIDSMAGYSLAVFGHSSFRLDYPKFLRLIFMSPSLHWIHHSNAEKHYDKNFSVKYCFWDKLFGTYLDESNVDDVISFGVKNSEYNKHHPFYSFFILPFKKIKLRIKSAIA
tara:strand:+ start:418 stop:1479 length:1062 start_codon:yes stop_codon:yes gene_type:complete